MQYVMYKHVALRAEIVQTVRASVPTQGAYPIRSGVHGRAASSTSRV